MRRLTRAPTTWPTSAILFQRLMRLVSRPFEHSGSMATLEDWFDTRRRRKDHVPTGFVGVGVNGVVLKNRAVTGHPFGLRLPPGPPRPHRISVNAFVKLDARKLSFNNL